MVISLIKNIIPSKMQTKKVAVKSDEQKAPFNKVESVVQRSNYKGVLYAAMFGVGLGIGDGLVTGYCTKRDLKKSLEEFKKCSFADKKRAVEALRQNGMSVSEYKKFIKNVQDLSIPKTMLKRGLLYGGIASVAGLAVNLYRNHKDTKTNKSK